MKRHYETKHKNKYDGILGSSRTEKIAKLRQEIGGLTRIFSKKRQENEAAVIASYRVAHIFSREVKPFSDGECVKNCLLAVVEELCPEKKNAVEAVSLSRTTIARRVEDMGKHLQSKLRDKTARFEMFSIAAYESTDSSDTAQLLVFIRGTNSDFELTEELATMRGMHGNTTGEDLFKEVSADLCRCLEAADLVSVVGLCLCSEQLYVSGALQDVPTELWEWWLRCVVRSGSETEMTVEVYETLVARFYGTAVTVTIPCISPPRLCLKILNQPSPSTTQCSYAVITLFPEQVHLLTMTSPRVMLAGPPGTGKTLVLQLKATEWLRCGSDVFLVCTSDRCAACYRMYYLLQQTIETQLAPTGTSGQLHLLEYRFGTNSDVENAVRDLSQAATGGVLHVIADQMDSFSSYLQAFHKELLTQVPHLHFWAASYYPESVQSSWQVQNLTRPIRFPETVKMELERISTVADHNSKTYSLRGEYKSPRGPPVQRFPLPKHKGSHRSTRCINRCVTCGEHVAKILLHVLAGVPGNITTSTAIAHTTSDTTSVRLQYRDVLVLPSIHVRYFMDLETGLRKAGIPVRYMTSDNCEDIITAREDEVVVADEEDVRGLERKVVVVIVDELEDAGVLAISRCTSQLVYITFRAEKQLHYEKKDTKEIQQKNREEHDALDKCLKKEEDDVKSQSTFFDADCSCYSVPYKFTADLSVTPSSQHIVDSLENNDNNARHRNENAAEKFENLAQSPIFRDHWQDGVRFTTEGGRLQRQGSDVVLQVPAGAIEDNKNVTVYSAICTDDDYIKYKLQLPATETIVSPLAEFWAGPDFHFHKHVQLTLPTCLPSEYDINLLHVYCISQNPEGQVDFSKLKRLDQLSETPGNKSTEAYFAVNEGGRVEVMTSHFSGYVCTYCGLCLNIGLEVYESHKRENGSLNVSIVTHFWDKLHLKDFRETKPELNSYTRVLSSTFQLRKVLTPAELQVDLIIDDEQTNLWQFIETLVPTTVKLCETL
ncbi:uncharacterized protein LOC112555545 [Pomacea canaliculata]|uniref:uncharacterized protein LOC112555545 n=1 Tax=Pomacea canaliculata TaxID=400727 RepID=UPI000D736701|nr:uncharacterized protein LOC112555545 [Pomacea canaliculata]